MGAEKRYYTGAPESCIYTDIQIFTKNRSTGAELWVGSGNVPVQIKALLERTLFTPTINAKLYLNAVYINLPIINGRLM